MQNGDLIVMQGWYHEVVIIPDPANQSQYYVFSIGVTASSKQGLWYSVVDNSANGGLGAVIQKNVQLQSFKMVDCLTAVKHGNGRDWWIIFRHHDTPFTPNNEFYFYLVTPTGLYYSQQLIGSTQRTNIGAFAFTNDGNRFAYINPNGLLELYDFDRCSGVISNSVTVYPESNLPPYETYWGVEFSPSSDLLYVTKFPLTSSDTARLYQFDLTAANIAASADTLAETPFVETIDKLKIGPDGKIYVATSYYQVYPYADSMYNYINMNLGTINNPDSLGPACDFQPYSFYLGGARTYGSLPNNPDYHLGPKIGSGCDTLTTVNEQSQHAVISALHPNPNDGEFSINYFLPNGSKGNAQVIDITGRIVYERSLPRYTYSQQFGLSHLAAGAYLLKISSGNKTAGRKFIKQ